MNQIGLARAIGITSAAISAYELGKSVPRRDVLQRLAAYFGVTIDWLLSGERLADGRVNGGEAMEVKTLEFGGRQIAYVEGGADSGPLLCVANVMDALQLDHDEAERVAESCEVKLAADGVHYITPEGVAIVALESESLEIRVAATEMLVMINESIPAITLATTCAASRPRPDAGSAAWLQALQLATR
jgi:transcriptional regulator with XRE-family HTH domain